MAEPQPGGEKMDAILKPIREAVPAIKCFHDNWGTRSGIDRRQKNGLYLGPERRIRTERRSGFDRRRLSFVQRRAVMDLRAAYRDLS
ncbi:MAG: hypothetical protein PVF29_08035 [Desulfobacterales bacterium]